MYSVPAAGRLAPQLACRQPPSLPHAVTIKYVMYANKSLILSLSLTLFSVELRKNVEKSKFQKGFEPTTYWSAGKQATHTATEALLATTYSLPLLTHFSYLAAAGRLVVGIDGRLPARYTLPKGFSLRLGTVDNHGNTEFTETVIFVKCRECRDFAKMPQFYFFIRIF